MILTTVLGYHYIAGIIIVCTFFYAHYVFPQGTRLMIDTSVPLIVRMLIALGLFVIPTIGFVDVLGKNFYMQVYH